MTPNVLFKLREWQTADEAAQLLSHMINEPVTKAAILRLALDGHLKLSVFLPEGTVADCWNLEEDTPPREVENGGTPQGDVQDGDDPTGLGKLYGVWDLPMVSPASLQVENWFNELSQPQLPQIGLDGRTGAVVERSGTHCRLRAEGEKYSSPASVLPAGSHIVVRTSALMEFLSELKTLATSPAATIDKPVDTKTRATLITIIAALAKAAKIPVEKPWPAAAKIEGLIGDLGSSVSRSTIAPYLQSIPDALERTSKTSSDPKEPHLN